MWITKVFTLFPEMFPGALGYSIPGKFLGKAWDLKTVNIRDYATDKHQTVDDSPCGGGKGMILKPDVVHNALQDHYHSHAKLVYVTPRGKPLQQKDLQRWINCQELHILCGRYEGIDQRVIDHWKKHYNLEEVSIGDYVLSGGELPAQILIDGCVRLLPGVLDKEATHEESFTESSLEHDQFTKPQDWLGYRIPDVLLSGNHKEIAKWRLQNAHEITKTRRPDIVK